MRKPVGIAVVGCGGFALAHHRAARALEERGECRLVATCDPSPSKLEDAKRELDFGRRGVRSFRSIEEMLAGCGGEIEAITLPTPVPLHEPMHRLCVEAGLPTYLEKPPTLDLGEFHKMLDLDRAAERPTHVGFNYIAQEGRRNLQARVAVGDFGEPRAVGFAGVWPRPDSYYGRNDWAGRLAVGGRAVLDSPLANAMAHHVHNCLFWAGPAPGAWAEVVEARAALLRAREIESADTVFLEADTAHGTRIRLAMTHAAAGPASTIERIQTARASIEWSGEDGGRFRVIENGAQQFEAASAHEMPLLEANLLHFLRSARDPGIAPLTSLEQSRPFVELCHMAFSAGLPVPLADRERFREVRESESVFHALKGIAELCQAFIEDGDWGGIQALGARVGVAGRESLERPLVPAREAAHPAGGTS